MPTRHRKLPELTPQQLNNFWAKVDKRGTDECWPWTARCDDHGYGRYTVGKYAPEKGCYKATRIIWQLTTETDPAEMNVLHTCDNPPCCNPAHLFLGTMKDNTQDMINKNRHAHGPDLGAKISAGARRGENHPTHLYPERYKWKDTHPLRLHPERIRRGLQIQNTLFSDEHWQGIIDTYKSSGLSQRAFARQNGLKQQTLNKRIRRQSQKPESLR